ncbi:hypothetical protein ABID34_004359 [Chryseobacterium limigenitum]
MDYSIEPKTEDEYAEYADFPEMLSYFFEQIGGYGDTSVVSQLEKILNIDLSIFQKTYHPEIGMDFEEFESEFLDEYKNTEFKPDDYWISIDILIGKLNEFKQKIDNNSQYFSEIIFSPNGETSKMLKMDILDMLRYQEENPLTIYPENNGIITDENLKSSISELIITLENLKKENIEEVRLHYV